MDENKLEKDRCYWVNYTHNKQSYRYYMQYIYKHNNTYFFKDEEGILAVISFRIENGEVFVIKR